MRKGWAIALVAGFSAIAFGASAAQETGPQRNCAALNGMTIPAARIGLPSGGASVSSAAMQQSSGDPRPVCVVLGAIDPVDPVAPRIRFRVNLPMVWNGKAVHLGGGGYDGTLVSGRSPNFLPADREPVRIGYASFGSDSGHEGSSTDASFALNEEALVNFGGAQIKKTRDVAMAILLRHYGRLPRRTYFYGNSQGGHEGFLAAQRFPKDYDGVVAIHPAYNFTALQLSGLYTTKALYASPQHWISPAKARLLADAVVRKCDVLDGLKDGVLGNRLACRAAFDVQTLRCPGGRDTGETCLSDKQLATIRTFAAPTDFGTEVSGARTFGAWPVLDGALGEGSYFGLGQRAVPGRPPEMPTDAFSYVMADQGVRYMILRDPGYDPQRFVVTAHADAVRRVSALVDASSTDLDAFRRRGGKMLMMHGTVDMAIPPSNSVAYYERMQARYGGALPGFLRFYLAPGFGHGDGPYAGLRWTSLDVLDAWVDQGRAPGPQVVRSAKLGDRPLCEYPRWPRYRGSGDVRAAASFVCLA